jgi:hypothetical protein
MVHRTDKHCAGASSEDDNEMEELRRTTVEHHLSLQANLENLQERVRALETAHDRHQVIGLP